MRRKRYIRGLIAFFFDRLGQCLEILSKCVVRILYAGTVCFIISLAASQVQFNIVKEENSFVESVGHAVDGIGGMAAGTAKLYRKVTGAGL